MKILMPALLLAAFATAAHAADPLRRAVAARDWTAGSAACERLVADESRRPDRRQLSAAQYAEKAAHCAAIASGAGDQRAAAWWWFTAVALDTESALALLPQFHASSLLLELPPPRDAVSSAEKLSADQVLLLSGEIVAGEQPTATVRPRAPKHMFRPVSGVASAEVSVEVLIDTEGYPTQPLLVSAQALPLHALMVFDFVRQWRFTPARVKGEPVASAYRVTVGMSSFQ
jgi:hypothetical protein